MKLFLILFALFALLLNPFVTNKVFAEESSAEGQVASLEVTPQPEPIPAPVPSGTEPAPSETPAPSATPTPSSPQPTPTPEPSATPTPESSPSESPSPSISPTPAPSASPTPSETPSPSPSATPEPDPSPTPSPSATLSPSDNLQPPPSPQVSVGTNYDGPSGSNVTVRFTAINGTPGSLSIQQSTLSEDQVNQLGALIATVYDISSSMANGTFSYDLTLPLPQGVGNNFTVKYASSLDSLGSAQEISENITVNEDGTFTIHNLNHFTIFVVVNPNTQSNCDAVTIGTTPGTTCYTTIQAAVNAASNGDTINVGQIGSPYNETVYVNKQLTFTGSGNPTVTAFVLQTTPVTISGITITSVTIATPTVSLTNPVNSGNQTTTSITGTGAANATINYTITGTSGSVTGTGTVSSAGVINIANINVNTLPDGALTLSVTLTSGSYSSSAATASAFKDTVAPAPVTGLTITNPINSSNQTSVTISGNGEAGARANWTIANGGVSITNSVTILANGTFTVSNINVITLPDGTLTLTVTVTDTAGNTSTATSTTAIKDIVAPTVSSGGNQTKNATFTQIGSASDAISGVASVTWSKISGPGTITFGSASAISTTISASTDGTYVIRLTATDSAGNSSNATFTLVWDTQVPTISGLTNATTNTIVTRTATVSDPSPSSGIATSAWTQVSGPGTVIFGSATALSTTISADTQGTYSIRFTATDSAGNSSNQTITLVWDTTNPTVSSGSNQTKNATFTQIGSASDATSGVASVTWSKISGPGTITFGSVNATTTTISASVDGTYVLQLTATDAAGNSANSTFTLTWDTQAPVISGLINVTTNISVTRTATVTDPTPSSGGLSYAWTQVSGPTGGVVTFGSSSSFSTTLSANVDGVYTVRFTTTDAAGNSANQTITITWDTTNPTVSAGTNPQNKNASFTQTGTASDTLSGVASVSWSQVSGPGTITFGSANALVTTISANTDGTYVLRLTVLDNAGNSNSSTFTLNWDTVAPTVSSGSNQTKNAGFTQDATVTDASPSSGGLTYQWTKVSGPGTLTFGSPNAEDTTVSANADGSYVIQLSVTDAAGNSSSSTFNLTWDTVAPTVNAGSTVNAKVTFTTSGAASDSAPSSGGLTYQWTKQSGPGTVTFGSANQQNTTVSASADGAYVIRLTVTDAAGNSNFGEFTLNWDTVAPTVNAGNNLSKNASFTTTATATDPSPASGITTYAWSQVSGPGVITFGTPNALNTTISANADGIYVLRLTVTDNASNSASSTFTLTWDSVSPTVSAGTNIVTSTQATTSATASDPSPSSGIATYAWTQVSGPTGGTITFGTPAALNTTVSANVNGTYTIRLTVSDNAGNNASSTVNIVWDTTVPTVNAGSNKTTNIVFTTNAAATDPAPTSGIATYAWTKVSGPGVITFGSSNALNTTVSANADGTYVLRLTVTDNAGNSNSSTFTLTWQDSVAPSGSWTQPSANTDVSGSVLLTAAVSDPTPSSGIGSVTFSYKRNDGVDSFHIITTLTSGPFTVSWDTNNLALDNYTLRLTVTDNAGNTTVVDQTVGVATVVSSSSVSAGLVTSGGVVINWTTDDPTSSRVIYDTVSHSSLGSSPNYGYERSTSTFDTSSKVTNHSVTLSGLGAGTRYFYRVVSAGSPEAVSSEFSFTTSLAVAAQGGAGGPQAGAGPTSALTCTDARPGSAPALLSSKVRGNKVILVWSKAQGPLTHYLIEYGTGHDNYQFGVSDVGNVTEFEIGELTPGKTYYFRVRAGNHCAPGEFSNELSATAEGSTVSAISEALVLGLVNGVSSVLGASDVLAAEENQSIASIESTPSASPAYYVSPNPNSSKKGGVDWRVFLIVSGIAILAGGAVTYYRSLKTKV